ERDPDTGTYSSLFDGIDKINATSITNIEGTLSGPIVKDKFFFFSNVRYFSTEGWLYGRKVFNPGNITDNTDPDPAKWIISTNPEVGRGDSSLVPMNPLDKIYLQGKLTYRLSPTIRLRYNFIRDHVKFKDFDFSFKFDPLGIPTKFRTGTTHLLNINHVLSSKTFYQAGISLFIKDFRQYVFKDVHDPRYVHPLLLGQNPPFSFKTGGMDLKHFTRNTRTWVGKIDLTSQISQTHQIKTGAEFRQHRLYFEDIDLQPAQEDRNRRPVDDGNPFIKTEVLPSFTTATDRYVHRPREFSAYIQDKMEFKDIIVNVGVRFDLFDPDGVVLADPSDPNIYAPLKPSHRFKDLNNNGIQDPGEPEQTVEERRAYWFKKATVKTQVSPRLGVAFPITDRGVIHFSYGYFFQVPSFDLLYQNPEFELGAGTGNLGIIGNADLKPQQTVNGEIGLQQQLSDDISIDLTGYFRDIRDLAGTRADEIRLFGAGSYNKFVNSDFGFVRGIVVTLEKRLRNHFGATLDYTLQTAKGNASDPAETRNAIAGGREPEVQLVPLDWDQTHTLNVTATYSDPKNWGISMIFKYGSGLPYTPRQSADIAILLKNSERRPSFFNADLRSFKNFRFGRLDVTAFLRVFNIFDIRNQLGVYDDTGRADFTLDELLARRLHPPLLVNSLGQFFRNPSFYSEPRRVEIGFSVSY
ncbi:MAG: TonB-dependent receptor, partial [Calditrichaeota bacterium]